MNASRPLIAGCAIVCVAAGARYGWRAYHRGPDPGPPHPAGVTVPAPGRIRVEVLNATRVRGLARRATVALRDLGFDVVLVGTTTEPRDSTLVLDRSNHPDWARRVAAGLGGARVEYRLDSTRYVDVTVLLGAAWRPPAQPVYP